MNKPTINGPYRLLTDDDLWSEIQLTDGSKGATGDLVEEYIKRTTVTDVRYDSATSMLFVTKNGQEDAGVKIEIKETLLNYYIKLYGIKVNNEIVSNSENNGYIILPTKNNNIYVGVVVQVIEDGTIVKLGASKVAFSIGELSFTSNIINATNTEAKLNQQTGELEILKDSAIKWILVNDFKELDYNKGNAYTLNASIISGGETVLLADPINNIYIHIPEIIYTKNEYILEGNIINFDLKNAPADKYKLEYFNNGNKFNSNSLSIPLVSGKNQICVKAVHTDYPNILSNFYNIDVISKEGCISPQVVINGVSGELANNSVSELYNIAVYNPDKNLELTIETFLGDSEKDIPLLKKEVVDNNKLLDGVTNYTYSQYLEVSGANTTKYLLVKINGEIYKFYQVDYYEALERDVVSEVEAKLITIEKVNSNLTYYSTQPPTLNFDLIVGYNNNVFRTKNYYPNNDNIIDLEAYEGFVEDSGRILFRIALKNKSIFKSPLNLSLQSSFSIEFGIRTYNIVDDKKALVKIGNLFELRPTEFCWSNESLREKRNSLFQEGIETHIMITYLKNWKIQKSDPYYPDYFDTFQKAFDDNVNNFSTNLMRIYINGTIDREIAFSDAEASLLSGLTLDVVPEGSDIDFSVFRVYDSYALNFEEIHRNYMSFLKTKEEKLAFFNKNDILNSKGLISFKKAYKKVNCLVYVYSSGASIPTTVWGDPELAGVEDKNKNKPCTLFITYAQDMDGVEAKKINEEYGGKLTWYYVKPQGSSARRYMIHNPGGAVDKIKVKELLLDDDGNPIIEDGKPKEISVTKKSGFYSFGKSVNGKFASTPDFESGYKMPKYSGETKHEDLLYKKLVAKNNWASSMQSHKEFACKLFNDAYDREYNSQWDNKIVGFVPGKKAVILEPFLYFYIHTNMSAEEIEKLEFDELLDMDSNIKFMGFNTWGPGKGDKPVSGYDKKDYLVLEGAENSNVATNFRCPWHFLLRNVSGELLKNPVISYEESLIDPIKGLLIKGESIHLENGVTHTECWDIDFGVNDDGNEFLPEVAGTKAVVADNMVNLVKQFREFYDFVYEYDYTFNISDSNSPQNDWDLDKKYVITSTNFSINGAAVSGHTKGDLYRYDPVYKEWVKAGKAFSNNSWEKLNVYNLAGVPSSTPMNTVKELIKTAFKLGITKHVNIRDIAYNEAFVKYVSGTDNKAKNTYFLILGPSYYPEGCDKLLIQLIGDDLDTIFATDNNGLQSKPYNLLERPYREEDKKHWGDANNIFFYMFDDCFESEIKNQLLRIVEKANANKNTINNKDHYLYKNCFAIQENYPSIAYNHTANIYYETALILTLMTKTLDNSTPPVAMTWYNNNEIVPIELSHGACLEGEKLFLTKRLGFLVPYSLVKEQGTLLNVFDSTGGAKNEATIGFTFSTSLDTYPSVYYDRVDYFGDLQNTLSDATRYLATSLVGYNKSVHFSGTNSKLYSPDLFKTLKLTGSVKTSLTAEDGWSFPRLTELVIDESNLSIGTFAINAPVLERLVITGINVPEILNLSNYYKLKELILSGTNVKLVILPQNDKLNTVILPAIESLKIYDNKALDYITVESWQNLKSIYIDLSKIGKNFNFNELCLTLTNQKSVNDIELVNLDITISEDILLKLLKIENCRLTGKITVKKPGDLTNTAIAFNTKKLLVEKFGNIDNPNNSLVVIYRKLNLLNVSCSKEIYVYQSPKGSITTIENPFNLTALGNTIVVENDKLAIDYLCDLNTYITIDPITGNITVNREGLSGINAKISVKYLYLDESTPRTVTIENIKIYPQWSAPKIGLLAYGDGTFSYIYDTSKDLIGLVYHVDYEDTLKEKGKAYIIGKEYSYPESLSTGMYIPLGSSYSNAINEVVRIFGYKDNISKYYANISKLLDYRINANTVITSIEEETNLSLLSFFGKQDTDNLVLAVNNFIKSLDILDDLTPPGFQTNPDETKEIVNIESALTAFTNQYAFYDNYGSNYDLRYLSIMLNPYFYSMYLYEPKVTKNILHSLYKKNCWYSPSITEMSYVIKQRAKSARQNFTIINSLDYELNILPNSSQEAPAFSLALYNLGSDFPVIWKELSSNKQVVTVVDNNYYTLYLYIKLNYYNNLEYNWIASGNSTYTTKQGIPFTEFKFDKNA